MDDLTTMDYLTPKERFGAFFHGGDPRRPERARQLSEERKEALAQDILLMDELGRQGDIEGVKNVLWQRYDALQKLGGDPSETVGTLELLSSNDPGKVQEALADLSTAANRERTRRKLIADQKQVTSPVDHQKGSTGVVKVGDKYYHTGSSFNPRTNKWDMQLTPIEGPGGGQVNMTNSAGLTADEQVEIARLKAEATSTGRGQGDRIQTTINEGLDAAQGAAVLRRALGLLDSVETGGLDAAVLAGKRFFGIESGDEAELSTNLGKAVLSQLRATFGSQFTEREGARLERIEAGFGKSTEGNRRLLNQTLQLVERAADRGIRAAVNSNDYRTAADIQELMNYQLSDEALGEMFNIVPTPNTPAPTVPGVKFMGFE